MSRLRFATESTNLTAGATAVAVAPIETIAPRMLSTGITCWPIQGRRDRNIATPNPDQCYCQTLSRGCSQHSQHRADLCENIS